MPRFSVREWGFLMVDEAGLLRQSEVERDDLEEITDDD